jgi:hypothetical protein
MAQLAIPPAPRAVSLLQVPGALRRLGVTVGVGSVLVVALVVGARALSGRLSAEGDFFSHAEEVTAQVADVRLPPPEVCDSEPASLHVIYEFKGRQLAASIEADGLESEGLARGSRVLLLVDPRAPAEPREALRARRRAGAQPLGWAALTLGVGLVMVLAAFELRRAFRRELDPLRRGMLVWLTPPPELPPSRGEVIFPASYWRDDVAQQVTARARPGRAPVRNGEKLLAALLPSEPRWVRVIDEDLARALGWYR